jgi:hypothetical protein
MHRYWGIDEALRLRLAEEARLRQLWEDQVEKMRVKCIQVKVVRPNIDEAKQKVFRHYLTNKVIT